MPYTDEEIMDILKNKKPLPESEYLAFCRRLHEKAIIRLRVLNHARKVTEAELEELSHAVVEKVSFIKLHLYDPHEGRVATWLNKITTTTYLDYVRTNQYKASTIQTGYEKDDDDSDTPDEDIFDRHAKAQHQAHHRQEAAAGLVEELRNIAYSVIDKMENKKHKDVLMYSFKAIMPDDEIARQMEISESCVRSYHSTAMKEFKQIFISNHKKLGSIDIKQFSKVTRTAKTLKFKESDLISVTDTQSNRIMKMLILEETPVIDICRQLQLPEPEVRETIRRSILLLGGGEQDKMKKSVKDLTVRDNDNIARYVADLKSGRKNKKTRADTGDSREVSEIKEVAGLLAELFIPDKNQPAEVKPIGMQIEEKAKQGNISYDKLCEQFEITDDRLMSLLNGTLDSAFKSKPKLVSKIAGFLAIPESAVRVQMDLQVNEAAAANVRAHRANLMPEQRYKKLYSLIYAKKK